MSRLTVVTCNMCGRMICGKENDIEEEARKISIPCSEGGYLDGDLCIDCVKELQKFIATYPKVDDNSVPCEIVAKIEVTNNE